MVSHTVLSTMTVQPCPLSSPSTHWRVKWLTQWFTKAADVPGMSKKQVNSSEYLLTLGRACYGIMSIGSKHILKPKKLKSLATKASRSFGSNYTVFGHLAREKLCFFFLSSLIIFLCPIMPGGQKFPGCISCLIRFKSAKERWGGSSPRRDNREWDNSFPLNAEPKQLGEAHPSSYFPACPEHLAFKYADLYNTVGTDLGSGSVCFCLSSCSSFY